MKNKRKFNNTRFVLTLECYE